MTTVAVTPLRILDTTDNTMLAQDSVFNQSVRDRVKAINKEISKFREERKSTLIRLGIGIGMGISGVVFAVKNRFLSQTHPTLCILSTIGNIAFLIFGLGFCLKNALWLKWQRQEIDGRVQEFMQKAGSKFIVRRYNHIEDGAYTEEEKKRMSQVGTHYGIYRPTYCFVQDDVLTVTLPVFSLFSPTQEMQIKEKVGHNTLDRVKNELKPWRDLLCEMTQPEHLSKFSEAEFGMVVLRTRSVNQYSVYVSTLSKSWKQTYAYNPKKNGEITVGFSSSESSCLVINKAEEFRQFLKDHFSFDPDPAST